MGSYKEDTSQNFGILICLILFSLFVFASSGNPENPPSSSDRFPSQNELISGDILGQRNALIFRSVSLPDPQKYCEPVFHSSSLVPFSIKNIISACDRRIVQNLILIQKTRMAIEPVPSWSLYFYHPSNKDDIPPVLS